MTDLPLAPKKANDKLRPSKANEPGNLSEKERQDLLDRYSLEELVRIFGRWPTYYLVLRQKSSANPGKFVIGASVLGVLAAALAAYLKH
jgi:hypothetical protein